MEKQNILVSSYFSLEMYIEMV